MEKLYMNGVVASAFVTIIYFVQMVNICQFKTKKSADECSPTVILYAILAGASWFGVILSVILAIDTYMNLRELKKSQKETQETLQ